MGAPSNDTPEDLPAYGSPDEGDTMNRHHHIDDEYERHENDEHIGDGETRDVPRRGSSRGRRGGFRQRRRELLEAAYAGRGPAFDGPDQGFDPRRGRFGPGAFGPGGFGPREFGRGGFGPGRPGGPRNGPGGFGPGRFGGFGPGGFGPRGFGRDGGPDDTDGGDDEGWGGGRGGRGGGPGRGGRGGGRRPRGNVRAAVLALLREEPRHGYAIMTELAERSGGLWRPSPGSVYPVLQQLQDEGLVTAEESEGRKIFSITDAGRALIDESPAEFAEPWSVAGPGPRQRVQTLFHGMAALGGAVQQVARLGSAEQAERARIVLDDARRALYRILAEDDVENPGGEKGSPEKGSPEATGSGPGEPRE